MKNNKIIKIYVPSTTNINEHLTELQALEAVNNTAAMLAGLFGGCTSQIATGCWISDDYGLVSEKITVVYSFCTRKQLKENKHKVIEYCKELKKQYKQEAISLEINGALYFI